MLTFVYSMCIQEKKEAVIFHVFAYKYKYAQDGKGVEKKALKSECACAWLMLLLVNIYVELIYICICEKGVGVFGRGLRDQSCVIVTIFHIVDSILSGGPWVFSGFGVST